MSRFVMAIAVLGVLLWSGVGIAVFSAPDNPSPVAQTVQGVSRVLLAPSESVVQAGAISYYSETDSEQIANALTAFLATLKSLFSFAWGGSSSQSALVREPTCTITVAPSAVPYGGSATVTWSTKNAQAALFQGMGSVGLQGTYQAKDLTSSRAFALAIKGEGGTSSCYTTINVGALVTTATPAKVYQ